MAVIARVERGEVSVTPEYDWDVAWTNWSFRTADGWTFIVFNDGGHWDYIEHVHSPDGRSLEPEEIDEDKTPNLDAYCPRSVEIARRWGLSEQGARMLMRFSR